MKLTIVISSLLLQFIVGCGSATTSPVATYIESQPSFYELRHGDPTTNSWIRNPKNLLMIHETFKKIGYRNLLTTDIMTTAPFIEQGIYINKPLKVLLDSLEITYTLDYIPEKYYREFWDRRKKEKNDSMVYLIVKEINASFKNMIAPSFDDRLTNDTLFNLALIECRKDPLNASIAIDNFTRLKKYGFHQSAYNLLYNTAIYQNIQWNKDSLSKTLTSSNSFVYPWFEDTEK